MSSNGRPRANRLSPMRYIALTGEKRVDFHALWRQTHMKDIQAILDWAETDPAERVWPEKSELPDGR